jgi:hypothetical protein
MRKRIIATVIGTLAVIGATAGPAGARSDATLTETCSDGTVIVVDANARHGLESAETHYNAVNPFGTVCSLPD